MTAATPPSQSPGQKSAGYQVGRPQGLCAVTGGAISPGQRFITALRETPVGLERIDLSVEAWPDFRQSQGQQILAFWQAVMPTPESKPKPFIDDQVLCELLERLGEATQPVKVNFRFVLALILMRKRLVIYESTRTDQGRELWTVRLKGREQSFDLLNPRLEESQIVEVSTQLSEILNQEF
jgi:hypothetical protein